MAFWRHRASKHQVAGDAGWRHLLGGSEGNALDCVRSRFERALLELDRDRSGRQTGSGAYRVGTAGGIGGGGVGVPFPSSMSIQFPQIQLQFHSCNWDPIPQFQLRIGTHTAISIPIGAPISMTGPCNRKCPIYWAFQLHWAQLAVAIQFNRYFLSRVHVEPALRIGTGIL